MTTQIIAMLFGATLVCIATLLIFYFQQKQWRLLLPLAAVSLLSVFLYQDVVIEGQWPYPPSLLLAATFSAFIGFVLYWPKMLSRMSEYLWQWLLLLTMIIVVVLNQMLLKELLLYCFAPFIFTLTVLAEQLNFLSRQARQVEDLQQQLNSKNLAIGLDLATGLPNKLAFTDRIDKWLVINPEQKLNVLVFKFTQFDLLNSLIGHHNADVVKTQLISRVKKQLQNFEQLVLLSDSIDTAFVATLGGVDFTIALHDKGDNYVTENIMKTLSVAVREPLVINATAVDVGIEFGVSSYPEQGLNTEDLIEHALLALSLYQRDGQSRYFTPKLQKKLQTNRTVVSQLREDITNNKFELFVQPQVNLNNRVVEGGEVLVRWRRDEGGVLDAAKFIELAEESGVIYQLSLWTLRQTVTKLAQLQSEGKDQYLAVNISNKELFNSQLVENLSDLIEEFQIAPSKLVLEIRESAFAVNQHKALKITRMLEHLGVKIALDDFGKDKSAMHCFNQFEPFYVKIDCKSLNVKTKADRSNTYLNAIIGMAQTLQIKTIAHGIELETTLKQLIDIQCDVGQGFLFSKPFELSGFDIWLNQWLKKESGALDTPPPESPVSEQ